MPAKHEIAPTSASELHKTVDWDLQSPCNDCPFLKATPYHGGIAGGMVKMLKSIENSSFGHTCHKTDNRPMVAGPRNYQGDKPQHCAGAIISVLKSGKGRDLQIPLLHAAVDGLIDLKVWRARAEADTAVMTIDEMTRFYIAEIRKRLKKGNIK